jgi:phosphosulfolactate synthase (CoM biosynthesis protein A)
MGEYVDSLKFAGGSFSLMPRPVLIELLKVCHEHDALVSTGGFLEYVLTQGPDAVNKYVEESKQLGFDIIEISCGLLQFPPTTGFVSLKSAKSWAQGKAGDWHPVWDWRRDPR